MEEISNSPKIEVFAAIISNDNSWSSDHSPLFSKYVASQSINKTNSHVRLKIVAIKLIINNNAIIEMKTMT